MTGNERVWNLVWLEVASGGMGRCVYNQKTTGGMLDEFTIGGQLEGWSKEFTINRQLEGCPKSLQAMDN